MNRALHSVRADYVPPIVFLSFVLKSFLPVATCKSRWWSCFVSCANYPSWYATFNQPALISDTRTSPGLQRKVCNSDLIASKRDRSTFLQDQANCWQATQMHKLTSNNPACTVYARMCGRPFQMQTHWKRLEEFYLVWLQYSKCWKTFEVMFICF